MKPGEDPLGGEHGEESDTICHFLPKSFRVAQPLRGKEDATPRRHVLLPIFSETTPQFIQSCSKNLTQMHRNVSHEYTDRTQAPIDRSKPVDPRALPQGTFFDCRSFGRLE